MEAVENGKYSTNTKNKAFLFTSMARNIPRKLMLASVPMFNKCYPVFQHGDKILYAPLLSIPDNKYRSEPVAYIGKYKCPINDIKIKPRVGEYKVNFMETKMIPPSKYIIDRHHIPNMKDPNILEKHLADLSQISSACRPEQCVQLYDVSAIGKFHLKNEIQKKISTSAKYENVSS